jgi:TctA family transporter
VIGFVLASPFEEELRTALQLSDGSLLAIVDHPVALVFVVLAVLMLIVPFLRGRLSRVLPVGKQPGTGETP